MNNGIGRLLKETVMVYLKMAAQHLLGRTEGTMKSISQDGCFPS
jgi:hypothetical protein